MLLARGKSIFEEDDALHRFSKATKKFFNDKNITIFDWFHRFHEKNIVKNYNGVLFYVKDKRYSCIIDLQEAICNAWAAMPTS